ncbi:MAG TPA: RES domain-containing protein [Thermoanaerobaculia bacterium]|nr:RES domain-containing protein [Thermoanaerobaculia bacterium]
MKIWRLCKRRHASFDGEGARLAGGRWNRRGGAVVYASESLSLAALELLVHCDPALLPADLVAIAAEIPDSVRIRRLGEEALPRDWRRYPAPEALAKFGSDWLEQRETAVLSVPSAVVPRERNVLLNPDHPEFRKVRVAAPEAFSFDPRLTARR